MAPLTHYSRTPVASVVSTPRQRLRSGFKPIGLWVSVDEAGDGWAEWCRSEQFRLDSLAVVHNVELASDARVPTIGDRSSFDTFAEDFGVGQPSQHPWMNEIDWRRVADQYQGIIIAPYRWDRRLHGGLWYYGWDCASGCIWDAAAVASISVRQAAVEAA